MKILLPSLATLFASLGVIAAYIFFGGHGDWYVFAFSFLILNLGIALILRKWRPSLGAGLAFYGAMFFPWLIFGWGISLVLSCALGSCL